MKDAICRGSYRLGTACGECRRCVAFLVSLLADLTDSEPCRYDHHGYCQTHGLYERPCPHNRAKEVLTVAKHIHGMQTTEATL